ANSPVAPSASSSLASSVVGAVDSPATAAQLPVAQAKASAVQISCFIFLSLDRSPLPCLDTGRGLTPAPGANPSAGRATSQFVASAGGAADGGARGLRRGPAFRPGHAVRRGWR